jgi:toxin ParE1/3/4
MATLVVSPEAREDIRSIVAYLRDKAGAVVAQKYLAKFDKAGDLLARFPGIGTPKPSLGHEARTTVVAPYVLIYDDSRSADTVTLLRVVHGRRRITIDLITRQ